MIARSFFIRLVNSTSDTLTRNDFGLSRGVWSGGGSAVPPDQILAGHAATWQSESKGFTTGTDGTVSFGMPQGPVNIKWGNPLVGANTLEVSVPPGITRNRSLNFKGNHAAVEIILSGGIIND